MERTDPTHRSRRQVFLSYASEDKAIATRLADALKNSGVTVWFKDWELAAGDSIVSRIEQAVASSDLIIVLLSPSSVASRWVQAELSAALSRELRDRAITVLPALIDDCDIPPLLADRVYIDLRQDFAGGVKRLVAQLAVAPNLEFSNLHAHAFESLVADLLVRLGFSVQRMSTTRDAGFDFMASYRSRDPFGAERTETWLVEVKLYREQRVSVSVLQQLLGYLVISPGTRRGLVVTNGRLTSEARKFLTESTERSGQQLRVIEGTELTSLLIQHPDLVQRYFVSQTHE
jgi:hypothetical protein